MVWFTFFSSEIYPLDPKDLLVLEDTPDAPPIDSEDVVLLLGNAKTGQKDRLYQGRKLLENAVAEGIPYVPVRIAFYSRRPKWDLLSPFIKKVRRRFYTKGIGVYHMDAHDIRRLGLERKIRTHENAYDFSKWDLPPEQREKQFNELRDSLKKKGFDDKSPLEIMLCRSMGIKDSLQQGHHRMMFCLEMGIDRVAVEFMAVSHAPRWCAPFFRWFYRLCHRGRKNG